MSNSTEISTNPMSERTFQELKDRIHRTTGIVLSKEKKELLEARLRKQLYALGTTSFEDYAELLRTEPEHSAAHQALIASSIVDESYLFRDESQFHLLREVLLPELLASKNREAQPSIRIWSAATAKGEEAYSIAMIVHDFIQSHACEAAVNIVATDINHQALAAARNGTYDQFALRNVPGHYKMRYLHNEDNLLHVSDELRRLVQFKALNLCDEAQMQSLGEFDIIFCRNVLLYFDLKTKQSIVYSLYNRLSSKGTLLLGHTERLSDIESSLNPQNTNNTLVYRKN